MLTVKPIEREYRYQGIRLATPAGMSPEQACALHAGTYTELVNAAIEYGEIVNGKQVITFKRAAPGDKGAAGVLASFDADMRACAAGHAPETPEYALYAALTQPEAVRAAKAWSTFTVKVQAQPVLEVHAPSELLVPLA